MRLLFGRHIHLRQKLIIVISVVFSCLLCSNTEKFTKSWGVGSRRKSKSLLPRGATCIGTLSDVETLNAIDANIPVS